MSDDTFTSNDSSVNEEIDAIEPDVVLDLTDDASDSDEDNEPTETPAWAKPGKWYVVHTQSGYEKKVDLNLKTRIQSMDMGGSIYEIVIPMEDVVEFKQGRKQTVQKKFSLGICSCVARWTTTPGSVFAILRALPGLWVKATRVKSQLHCHVAK